MKVLICGGREYTNRKLIGQYVSMLKGLGYIEIVEGECRGADIIAREEAEVLGFIVKKYPANWAKYGRAAGLIRNHEMLKEKPNLVIAFHEKIESSAGTANMLTQAEDAGIDYILVDD